MNSEALNVHLTGGEGLLTTHSLVNAATALSVNLNKVALVRNTRHLGIPSVVRAGQLCLEAGCAGLTVHPRPDERHIRLQDVLDLAALMQDWPDAEFNIEGNPDHNLLDVAKAVKAAGLPLHQLTFVPDSVGQATSDHGWDVVAHAKPLMDWIAQGQALGARVSLFMDADAAAMPAVKALGADRVELYTEPYAAAFAQAYPQTCPPEFLRLNTAYQQDENQATRNAENIALGKLDAALANFAMATKAAQNAGLGINAGHDLSLHNLPRFIAACPAVQEVSIGHALISDALEQGYTATVKAYLAAIAQGHAAHAVRLSKG